MNTIDEYKQTRQILFDKEGIQPHSKVVFTKGPVTRVHYLELGKGKPVILIHGGGSHSSEWINILKSLSDHFHLYVVDRPGCGLSDTFNYRGTDLRQHAVDFVGSFMDALGLGKAVFLAQSMGGYFSICFAMQYPERVEKLCLIGAPAGMNHWIPYILRLMGTRGLNSLLMTTVAKPNLKNAENIHKQILVADVAKLSDNYLKHVVASQLLPGTMKSFSTLLENALTLKGWKSKYYIADKLNQLKIPVGFIWGDKDAFEKPETGKKKAESINDYQFEIVDNAGHCPWLDQPEKCVSLILSMLKD
jgi:pimeloyl-ACP methyl ester carboxylesterase